MKRSFKDVQYKLKSKHLQAYQKTRNYMKKYLAVLFQL
jgi:hypothetical protein